MASSYPRTCSGTPKALRGTERPRSSVAVRPRSDVGLVALCIGQGPPLGRVLIAHQVTTSGEGRRDARLRLVVRHVDIDVDPVALGARRVHLLEPERRPLEAGVNQILVIHLLVAEHG